MHALDKKGFKSRNGLQRKDKPRFWVVFIFKFKVGSLTRNIFVSMTSV